MASTQCKSLIPHSRLMKKLRLREVYQSVKDKTGDVPRLLDICERYDRSRTKQRTLVKVRTVCETLGAEVRLLLMMTRHIDFVAREKAKEGGGIPEGKGLHLCGEMRY
jgi:hypothetical protein